MAQTIDDFMNRFVKAMGNPVVVGALTLAAAKLLKNQRNR